MKSVIHPVLIVIHVNIHVQYVMSVTLYATTVMPVREAVSTVIPVIADVIYASIVRYLGDNEWHVI